MQIYLISMLIEELTNIFFFIKDDLSIWLEWNSKADQSY